MKRVIRNKYTMTVSALLCSAALLSFAYHGVKMHEPRLNWHPRKINGSVLAVLTRNMSFTYKDCSMKRVDVESSTYKLLDSIDQSKMVLYGYGEWDTISRRVKITGQFEPQIDRVIFHLLHRNPSALFLDIGANIGIRSLQVAKRGTNVVAVEPLQQNVAQFCKSAYANNVSGRILIVKHAMSDNHNDVTMGKFANSMGASFVADDKDVARARKGSIRGTFGEKITSIKFDDLLEINGIKDADSVLVKLDIEGYEAHALKGASSFFRRKNVIAVVMEWRWHRGQRSATYIYSFFRKHLFIPYRFERSGAITHQLDFEETRGKFWPEDIVWISQKYVHQI